MEAFRTGRQVELRKLLPLLISSAIGIAILCGLGTWQVFRLAEKNHLIATLKARMKAPAISLSEAVQRQTQGEDVEYMLVKADGRRNPAHALAKISSFDGKPGWEIIEPFVSAEGIFVLVDRGPSANKEITPAASDETLNGVIRLHKKGRGFFDNDNDESGNIWYWWDLPAMQAAAQAPTESKIAQFTVQAVSPEQLSSNNLPVKVELNNNHLGYAVTWFGLAAALLAVAGFLGRSMLLDPNKRQG